MKNHKNVFLFIFFLLFLSFREVKILYAYDETPVEKGGELSGTITFKGDPPVNQANQVFSNPDFCGITVYDETYGVNSKNKGLENVVISIEGIERGKKAEDRPVVLEYLKCRFVPHVLAGMVGSFYEIRNMDPVLHDFKLQMARETILNVILPPNGRKIKELLPQAGIFNTHCDAHPFMKGTIFVAKNPYFAVTDKDGHYTIFNIPPGKYRVKIWHEALPAQEREIVIPLLKKVNLSMELSPK
ncbi:MAG: hypothetical protein HYR80_08815 [Nitrospirae bacterium]|nr:hypothetical protein [Nitrospirota bacterium]